VSNVEDPPAYGDRPPIRLLIVDDHEVLSSSLGMVLDAEPDISVVGRAPTLAEARRQVVSARPDVILLDHRLPDGDGVAAIRELRALHPRAQVVVLTASVGDHVLLEAVDAGAAGFLSKSGGISELTAAVRAAAVGESVIPPELLIRLLGRYTRREELSRTPLTEREQEVLGLVSEGLSNAAIAQRMVVSVHTVRNHIASLSAKLGAHSKLEALSIAVRQGLLRDL
jgi:DNA-binding NarL/FixJ family response regulator